MAAKILDDKKLKSRDEANADIEKLEREIEDQQQESADYETTWVTRQEQFNNIVRESQVMLRQIKGIKDESEKDERMGDVEEDAEQDAENEAENEADGRSPRPSDAGDAPPLPESGELGGRTPVRLTNKFLEVEDATRSVSRLSSPLTQPAQTSDDIDMVETVLIETYNEHQEPGKASVGTEAFEGATPARDVESMDET